MVAGVDGLPGPIGEVKEGVIVLSRTVIALTPLISSACDNILLTEAGCVELGIQSGGEDCIAFTCEDLPGPRGDDKKVVALV